MKRREALAAKDEGRAPRRLYAWDVLIDLQTLARQGALRFRIPGIARAHIELAAAAFAEHADYRRRG